MNLLIWTQHFWPENFRINDMAEILANKAELTILTGKPNYPKGDIYSGYSALGFKSEQYQGTTVKRIPLIPRKRGSAIWLALNYLSFIFSGILFAPLALRKTKIDAIFVYATSPLLQAIPAILLAKIRGVPLGVWVQDLWPESLKSTGFIKNEYILKLVGKVVGFIYRNTDVIFIQSAEFEQDIRKYVGTEKPVVVLPNAPKDFTLEPYLENQILKAKISKQFSVVFTGNMGKAQSCDTIIKAAEILKSHTDITFYLIGHGSEFEPLKQQAVGLSNVEFIGTLPSKDMPSVFESASVLLVTLKDDPAFDKTIPSKVQHYMCAGKPIVCSANGATSKLIADSKSGLACAAEDANALAAQVLKLYQMSENERELLGKNARSHFETHNNIDTHADFIISSLSAMNTANTKSRKPGVS